MFAFLLLTCISVTDENNPYYQKFEACMTMELASKAEMTPKELKFLAETEFYNKLCSSIAPEQWV